MINVFFHFPKKNTTQMFLHLQKAAMRGIKVWCLVYLCILYKDVTCEDNMTDLMNHLFTEYHKEVLPKCTGMDTVQVQVGMALRQIIELNEPKQVLQINAWLRLRWHDCRLRWNATEHDGVDKIIVPFNKIWVPDITLYDNAGSSLEGIKDYRPSISNDGSISYNFPTVITSLCKVDVTYFPFDTQTCELRFGSWAYHGLELNVTNRSKSGDLTSFVTSVEWEVTEMTVVARQTYYGCCPEPYPDVTFYPKLVRKPLFYLMNLMFPCMLITTVACLGFLLPPDSGEKVSLEITVLLSLAVFLLVVSETMPPSSETFPYIGIYFACAMLLVSCSCLMTVVVLNLHFKGVHGKEMPVYIRRLFLDLLGKLVFLKTHHNQKKLTTVEPSKNGQIEVKPYDPSFNFMNNEIATTENGKITSPKVSNKDKSRDQNKSEGSRPTEFDNVLDASELMKTLRRQMESLSSIEQFIVEKRHYDEKVSEWQLLAQVLDRLFLIAFFVISIISTLAILLQSAKS